MKAAYLFAKSRRIHSPFRCYERDISPLDNIYLVLQNAIESNSFRYLLTYRILMGKPEGNRPLVRPRRRRVNNIKMNLREVGWDGVDWIDMAQDRDQ
jgi:hypothetical protein